MMPYKSDPNFLVLPRSAPSSHLNHAHAFFFLRHWHDTPVRRSSNSVCPRRSSSTRRRTLLHCIKPYKTQPVSLRVSGGRLFSSCEFHPTAPVTPNPSRGSHLRTDSRFVLFLGGNDDNRKGAGGDAASSTVYTAHPRPPTSMIAH